MADGAANGRVSGWAGAPSEPVLAPGTSSSSQTTGPMPILLGEVLQAVLALALQISELLELRVFPEGVKERRRLSCVS